MPDNNQLQRSKFRCAYYDLWHADKNLELRNVQTQRSMTSAFKVTRLCRAPLELG